MNNFHQQRQSHVNARALSGALHTLTSCVLGAVLRKRAYARAKMFIKNIRIIIHYRIFTVNKTII